ncbi:MAG: hypothetical protein H0V17_35330 [Deltaproteobacteria bacterium]|nr:hypothetical protein [Deltaproteobacteria bacterium]
MGRVAVGIGDVFAFTAARRWVPCQIIGTLQSYWQVIVFDALSTKRPRASIVDGAPIYVLRHTRPKNEPLYLACPGDPPVGFTRLGRRPVALAFPLPTTFRTSPRAGDDSLPVHAEWSYARDQVKDDRSAQPPPFHSKLFPTWRVVDPRALRAIDAAVARFAAIKPATEAALRRCVAATNKHEGEIRTLEAEELFDKLVAIATRNKLDDARAVAVIDACRDW